MKPQDSKNTAPRSSSTQESANAQEAAKAQAGTSENESLESLIARLEQLNAPQEEENIALHSKELRAIIAGLEDDLITGRWFFADYKDTDIRLFPALVEQANRKYPGMNLKLALTAEDFTTALKETVESKAQSSRFIVNMGSNIHFAAIDYKTIDDKISLIMFEPTTFNNISAGRLGIKINQTLQYLQLPPYSFAMAEMDIQRSSSECGIFSLALAKKLHLESDKLARLHQDNVKGVLCAPDTPLPAEKLDPYLPARLYKHAQGRKRLEQYLKANPEAALEKVNKKQETLMERFEKNLHVKEEKTVSVSPHRKRITEYKSLMISLCYIPSS
ncbi:YopJ/AvrA family T3SS effector serine/threonine acetyltransferase [Bartonella massiliensis]|uniref:YopJ/AvrA family T3SS effector serine/threonine acetyltransferase n=1 Tax=Bartonella massiliensis TaxID=929795 RepID=UPI001157EABD|nr:YopJ/AvrA family T3SS effector serine/threonine acetyltransferase [Bartonella massiliensis]